MRIDRMQNRFHHIRILCDHNHLEDSMPQHIPIIDCLLHPCFSTQPVQKELEPRILQCGCKNNIVCVSNTWNILLLQLLKSKCQLFRFHAFLIDAGISLKHIRPIICDKGKLQGQLLQIWLHNMNIAPACQCEHDIAFLQFLYHINDSGIQLLFIIQQCAIQIGNNQPKICKAAHTKT